MGFFFYKSYKKYNWSDKEKKIVKKRRKKLIDLQTTLQHTQSFKHLLKSLNKSNKKKILFLHMGNTWPSCTSVV